MGRRLGGRSNSSPSRVGDWRLALGQNLATVVKPSVDTLA